MTRTLLDSIMEKVTDVQLLVPTMIETAMGMKLEDWELALKMRNHPALSDLAEAIEDATGYTADFLLDIHAKMKEATNIDELVMEFA